MLPPPSSSNVGCSRILANAYFLSQKWIPNKFASDNAQEMANKTKNQPITNLSRSFIVICLFVLSCVCVVAIFEYYISIGKWSDDFVRRKTKPLPKGQVFFATNDDRRRTFIFFRSFQPGKERMTFSTGTCKGKDDLSPSKIKHELRRTSQELDFLL